MKNQIAIAVNFLVSFFRRANEKMGLPVLIVASVISVFLFVLFVSFVTFAVKTVVMYAPYMRME